MKLTEIIPTTDGETRESEVNIRGASHTLRVTRNTFNNYSVSVYSSVTGQHVSAQPYLKLDSIRNLAAVIEAIELINSHN